MKDQILLEFAVLEMVYFQTRAKIGEKAAESVFQFNFGELSESGLLIYSEEA